MRVRRSLLACLAISCICGSLLRALTAAESSDTPSSDSSKQAVDLPGPGDVTEVDREVGPDKVGPDKANQNKANQNKADQGDAVLQSIVIATGGNPPDTDPESDDASILLVGSESRQQLVVDGYVASGQVHDMTHQVAYSAIPEGIVEVTETGVVTPLANGTATIYVRSNHGVEGRRTVVVKQFGNDPHVNFSNQIVPIFSKYGCNGGGCHGKSGGQNGFRLSLLGFEPAEDFEYLTKEARGRRLSLAAPEHSLLLLKAIGDVPHGGGPKLAKGDPSYNLIRRWIAEGATFGDPKAAKVESISVYPSERIMARNSGQQLVVVAHYTDGGQFDVSSMAQYEPNVTEMADVDTNGYVSIADQAGDVAIMVRYQSQVAVFRATVPLGAPIEKLPPVRNFVDEAVFAKLRQLGMPPSAICDDQTFLRRVTVDICGRIPTYEEAVRFQADTSANKRQLWIETLLDSTDYADNFANKWSAILRNKRKNDDYKRGTFAFHSWIRDAMHENLPYDEFVRAIVAASGEVGQHPPVAWYREVDEINEQVEDTAQLFLGMRIQCARCHHHPFEKWSRRDYYSFSAFFSRVGRKQGVDPGETEIIHKRGTPSANNPKDNQPLKPAGLGGDPMDVRPEFDPRHMLVDWMSHPENPYFSRVLVNRYWKHFFDRGLVDPEDDMRATNPACNPQLLEELANSFVESRFDLKQLVRTICNSSVYQLSSEPNENNISDNQAFSRYYPRRLKAETLLDAVDQVTGAVTTFDGVPAGTRAIQLPDSGFDNYFLKVFGRPESASACECERSTDANLAQSLHLINSSDIHGKISADVGRAAALASEKRDKAAKIRDLYLTALARDPTPEEAKSLMDYLEKKAAAGEEAVRPAYEDIVWTLINTKEFLFNH